MPMKGIVLGRSAWSGARSVKAIETMFLEESERVIFRIAATLSSGIDPGGGQGWSRRMRPGVTMTTWRPGAVPGSCDAPAAASRALRKTSAGSPPSSTSGIRGSKSEGSSLPPPLILRRRPFSIDLSTDRAQRFAVGFHSRVTRQTMRDVAHARSTGRSRSPPRALPVHEAFFRSGAVIQAKARVGMDDRVADESDRLASAPERPESAAATPVIVAHSPSHLLGEGSPGRLLHGQKLDGARLRDDRPRLQRVE